MEQNKLEKKRAYNRNYQRFYRKKRQQTASDVTLAELARKTSEYNRRNRERHKEKIKQYQKDYQAKHIEEKRLYDKLRQPIQKAWRRERRLWTPVNGKLTIIKGILKRPYPDPSNCELCGKSFLRLNYHHWDNTLKILKDVISDKQPLFLKGIWVCQPCNLFIHRLTEFPDLVEKWHRKKEEIESHLVDVTSQIYG